MIDKEHIKNGIDAYSTYAAAGVAWAAAVGAAFTSVVPASTTVSTAQVTLSAALTSAFQNTTPLAVVAAMEIAFASFATTVATGMTGFVAVPPSVPVGFAALFAPPHPGTRPIANQELADAIYSWALTGTATIPSGPTVPWS